MAKVETHFFPIQMTFASLLFMISMECISFAWDVCLGCAFKTITAISEHFNIHN